MSEPGLLIRSLSGRQSARNFHSFVINEIGLGVASGSFALGSILPNDAELMDRYGVSRTVLREALKTLEAKGLVEARAKVGTRVQPRSRWNLFDRQVLFWIFHARPEAGFLDSVAELRRTLEIQAADLAARRRNSEQVRMMRYWLQQHDISAAMPEPCGLAAYEIHRLIFEASHNPLLRSATGLVEFALASALRRKMARGDLDFAAEKVEPYEALVRAVEAGDSPQAVGCIERILSIDEAILRAS
ncbi:GntR family transcriptional regulator [bacterium]|nr:GntR family transcriptional regulator [bacterium]